MSLSNNQNNSPSPIKFTLTENGVKKDLSFANGETFLNEVYAKKPRYPEFGKAILRNPNSVIKNKWLYSFMVNQLKTVEDYIKLLALDEAGIFSSIFMDPIVIKRLGIGNKREEIYNILCANLRNAQVNHNFEAEHRIVKLLRTLCPIPKKVDRKIDRIGIIRISFLGLYYKITKNWHNSDEVQKGNNELPEIHLGVRLCKGKDVNSSEINQPVTYGDLCKKAQENGKKRIVVVSMTRPDEVFEDDSLGGQKMDVQRKKMIAGVGDFLEEVTSNYCNNDISIINPETLKYDKNLKSFKDKNGDIDIKEGAYLLLDSDGYEIGAIIKSKDKEYVYLNLPFCDHSGIDARTGKMITGEKLREFLEISKQFVDKDAFLYEHCFSGVERGSFIDQCRRIFDGETILEAAEGIKCRKQAKCSSKLKPQLRGKLGELFVHKLVTNPERSTTFLQQSPKVIAENLAEFFFLSQKEITGNQGDAIENRQNFYNVLFLMQNAINGKNRFEGIYKELEKRIKENKVPDLNKKLLFLSQAKVIAEIKWEQIDNLKTSNQVSEEKRKSFVKKLQILDTQQLEYLQTGYSELKENFENSYKRKLALLPIADEIDNLLIYRKKFCPMPKSEKEVCHSFLFYSGRSALLERGNYRETLTFDKFFNFNDKELERRHNYIQILFPLSGKSEAQSQTFFLDSEEKVDLMRKYLQTEEGKDRYKKAFEKMLGFWGFEATFDTNNKVTIVQKGVVPCEGLYDGSDNHNYARMSRAMGSCNLMGFSQFTEAFVAALRTSGRMGQIPTRTVSFFEFFEQQAKDELKGQQGAPVVPQPQILPSKESFDNAGEKSISLINEAIEAQRSLSAKQPVVTKFFAAPSAFEEKKSEPPLSLTNQ